MKTGGRERKEETKVCEGEGMKGETKWRGREPMKPNLIRAPRDLPRLKVNAVCAPESGTGSNEPQKYFGRSDHVEALSQLGPLRSRKGMSQLGTPKMRQTSNIQILAASAICCPLRTRTSPGRGDNDRRPFDGSTGGTLRAHPGLSLGETHLWICVLT